MGTGSPSHGDAFSEIAASIADEGSDCAGRRLPRQTRQAIAGLSSDAGGLVRFATFRNAVASLLSRVAARWSLPMYQLMKRRIGGRAPLTSGWRRSLPTAMSPGMST